MKTGAEDHNLIKRVIERRKETGIAIIRDSYSYIDVDKSFEELFSLLSSEEEIELKEDQYINNFKEIEDKFFKITKLNKKDMAFLFIAVGLQCLRQYLLTDFKERKSHNDSSIINKEKDKLNKANEEFGDKAVSGHGKRFYHASVPNMLSTISVPYDVVKNTKVHDLKLGPKTHRYRTLGHDPLLGWFFGTANIMTDTMTLFDLRTYIVENQNLKNGKLNLVVENVIERTKEEPVALAVALIKQGIHIESDKNTKNGLPLPFLQTIDPEFARKVSEFGIDAANVGTVMSQMGGSIFINLLISMLHYLFYDEKIMSRDLYKVKTRKILLYSNLIASTSNIIYVAVTKNTKKLDVGGLLVTMYRLFSDVTFITKVKEEFINSELDKIYLENVEENKKIIEDYIREHSF